MQPVQVDEPTVAETITILHGLQNVMKIIIMLNIQMKRLTQQQTYPIVTFKIAFTR